MSFKLREENNKEEGRSYTNFTKEKLVHLIGSIDDVSVLEYLETADMREDRKKEVWISVVVRKEETLMIK